MKSKRTKAVLLSAGIALLSLCACAASVFIFAAVHAPRETAGVVSSAVLAAGLVASGMALVLIPEKTDRIPRLVGIGVICLALILVPTYGLWDAITSI